MKKIRDFYLNGYKSIELYSLAWWLRPFAVAAAYKGKIRVKSITPSQKLVRHEMIHILQGLEVNNFVWNYLKLWLKFGYKNHPYELDAREWEDEENFYTERPLKNWRKYL